MEIKLSTSTIGAIGELAVATDLLRMGMPVFRAMSPSAPCDLIALVSGHVLRIEVRTAKAKANGGLICCVKEDGFGKCDILALWVPASGSIVYLPNIESATAGVRFTKAMLADAMKWSRRPTWL